MQFWTYLLRCRDRSFYAGHTDNLPARLAQHQEGIGCDCTSRRPPVELAWCGAAPTRDEAFAVERRIKGWTRAKKEALIAGDLNEIGRLARPHRERPSTSLRTSEEEYGIDTAKSSSRIRNGAYEGLRS
ncbi:GIY-YIG nuclease family protein [Sphingomonas sp. LY160]|uniref:GIY-YIG nuclease family protein n=1 Tax=Sphingomonas sp. LY160 TaxID=3095342 RepID=UPI002ADEAFE7|nr:GIY-YIG nuclease family protein [Sphingomonas sp. LY160]MEA1071215.1 GIY-YIG nuclease family protein [Sphingomonas sp. LY160]